MNQEISKLRERRNLRLTKRGSDLLTLFVVFLLMALVTLTLREIANRPTVIADFESGKSSGSTTIVIEEGETGSEIAAKLKDAGVVKSARAFFQVALSDPRSERIAPGVYSIDREIPAKQALEQLLDLKRIQGLISLRDGVRLDEVISILKSNGYSNVERVIKDRKIPTGFSLATLEGFLYPAQYSFEPGTSTEQVIDAMIRRFDLAIKEFDLGNAPDGLNPDEILILASIIEAEGTPDVFGKISRVIYNRLAKRMALQMDSTIHYIKRERGNIAVSTAETKIKNEYNTYQRTGLPPGPIGSPTSAAIKAALNPEDGDWLYFITVAPKDTRFTKSYDQFLEWKELYRKNYRAGLFDD
jgi:UPF0755 protein